MIFFSPGNLNLFEAKLNFCAHHDEVIHSRATTSRPAEFSDRAFVGEARALSVTLSGHRIAIPSVLSQMLPIAPECCICLKRKLNGSDWMVPRVTTHRKDQKMNSVGHDHEKNNKQTKTEEKL